MGLALGQRSYELASNTFMHSARRKISLRGAHHRRSAKIARATSGSASILAAGRAMRTTSLRS
jgi:hypothetical protein